MKKILCIILAVLMIVSVSWGEGNSDFKYRNDIRFGDSVEEVTKKENYRVLRGSSETIYVCERVSLSGIDNCYLNYFFPDGLLNMILVSYGSAEEKDYSVIEEGLVRKYGDAENKLENMVMFPEGAIQMWIVDRSDYSEPVSVSQRIIPYIGYSVYIEHVFCRYRHSPDEDYKFKHLLSYRRVGDSESTTDIIDNDL